MSTHPLVRWCLDTVTALRGKPNAFASNPSEVTSAGARTSCSSFLTLALKAVYDVSGVVWIAELGAKWPRAIAYANAIRGNVLPRVTRASDIRPGDLMIIAYTDERDGMSGHCAVVTTTPRVVEKGEWLVRVADSCRSSHGRGDTRHSETAETGGIGAGYMVLIVKDDAVVGFRWSHEPGSQEWPNNDKQEIVFGRIPSEWPVR